MGMLTYKLPFIVTVAHETYILNRQIGVGESKYGVTGDPLLRVVRGSCDQILEFWDPLRISETVAARNSKFGMQMDPEGN